ncbi:winged helix-turn-helix domain-containing protein [Methanobrevibacter filiformis]|uniref:DNA-binding transcriptional regulator ModE n=1 Tax=Methanobrevibacter filiformis TaxID=55758 RepID=A0A166ET20_9EURY|nr:TOBE domain-containing protein [Methanobrevibacter filiformis]KZX16981.1 DNA-binding transcriptional regulator ModE [Methanobrevibacter filiformis]
MTNKAKVKAEAEYRVFYNDNSFHLDDKKFKLLNSINQSGSITAATKLTKISYRSALNYIDKIEKSLDISLVSTKKGGKGGGGSSKLTAEGKEVLKQCKIINALMKLHTNVNEFEAVITKIDKEKKVMLIDINGMNITLPLNEEYSAGNSILALVSYDNIFIMINECESSIRNLYKGTINEISLHGEIIRVKIDLGVLKIFCDITKSAYDDLRLSIGKEVFAGFKAASIATMKI